MHLWKQIKTRNVSSCKFPQFDKISVWFLPSWSVADYVICSMSNVICTTSKLNASGPSSHNQTNPWTVWLGIFFSGINRRLPHLQPWDAYFQLLKKTLALKTDFLDFRTTQLTHIATIGIKSIIYQTLTAPSIITRTAASITPAWECSSQDHALYSTLHPILVPTPLQILIHTLLQILIILEFRIVTLKRIAATTLDLDHH